MTSPSQPVRVAKVSGTDIPTRWWISTPTGRFVAVRVEDLTPDWADPTKYQNERGQGGNVVGTP